MRIVFRLEDARRLFQSFVQAVSPQTLLESFADERAPATFADQLVDLFDEFIA